MPLLLKARWKRWHHNQDYPECKAKVRVFFDMTKKKRIYWFTRKVFDLQTFRRMHTLYFTKTVADRRMSTKSFYNGGICCKKN